MSTEPTPMQFDKAEYGQGPAAPTGIACAACKRPIVDQYYEAASQVFCASCAAILGAGPRGGSRVWRTIEALLLGAMGGAVGALIWFLILKFTGYQISLIGILVGFLVGAGVRKGSRGRGGWFYQLMAIGLTYLAIVSTYVPLMVEGIHEEAERTHERLVNGGADTVRISVMADGRILLNGAEAQIEQLNAELDRIKEKKGFVSYYREGRVNGLPPNASSNEVHDAIFSRGLERASFKDPGFSEPLFDRLNAPEVPIIKRLMAYAMLWGFSLGLPFFMAKENPISLLIIGFALFQAWAINKKPKLAITGPFVLSPSATMSSGSIVHVPPPVTPPNLPPHFDEPPQGSTPS